MKRSFKVTLLSLSALAAIGALLWMRSLASWRPTKIGKIPTGSSVYFLSSDGETAFLSRGGKFPAILDVGGGVQTDWPVSNSWAYPDEFSPSAPNWAFTLKVAKQKSVEVRDLPTGRLERTFRWPKTQYNSQFVSDSDGNRVSIVEGDIFRQWDIATGQQLRQVQMDIRTLQGDSAIYAISPDGKRLVGCSDNRGIICDISSGKSLGSWKINSFGVPQFFSGDARLVAYTYTSSTNIIPPIVFVDTATGKVKWKAGGDSSLFYRTGNELLLPGQSGCDVLDVNTGRPKRHVPGPRQGDQILRATPDTICTQNANGEILRWRAH